MIKPAEGQKALRQAESPTDDFYIPDNSSNNVVNTEHIDPPPDEYERKDGFCRRTLSSGRERFICTR